MLEVCATTFVQTAVYATITPYAHGLVWDFGRAVRVGSGRNTSFTDSRLTADNQTFLVVLGKCPLHS